MQIRDLGRLEGEILLFGGIYGNLQALEAMMAWADTRGIVPEARIHTGDIAAYCADPAACVDAMARLGVASIKGNVEEQLVAGGADCGCGFEVGSACDLASVAWYAHAQAQLSDDQIAWMADLPDRIVFEAHGRRCAVMHGGADLTSRFLWPATAPGLLTEEHESLVAQVGRVDLVICGHSGLPFGKGLGRFNWLNAGAIGQPPHDGDPRTTFATLDAEGYRLHRLDYDHEAAAQAMEAAGLTQGYEAMLRTGWWPNEDILPSFARVGRTALD